MAGGLTTALCERQSCLTDAITRTAADDAAAVAQAASES
jgi:hypothetical protein